MKYILLLGILFISNILSAQSNCPECDKFKIVGLYDFGPPPGGNWVILLLTVEENLATDFDPHYSDLYFVTNELDTITKPFGPSLNLPQVSTDTIPFLLELNTEESNQDFPTDFDGYLVIRTPTAGNCPLITWCHVPYTNLWLDTEEPELNLTTIYPNPLSSAVSVIGEKPIHSIEVFNSIGKRLIMVANYKSGEVIDLQKVENGMLFLRLNYTDNAQETYKVLKRE